MKILLVAPQSKDTILGTIGCYCKKALITLGYNIEIFDFRRSRYLKSPLGSFLKKGIKKFSPSLPRRTPLINFLERERMNKSLLTVAKEYRPDILFVLMGDTIFPETLDKIKKSGITTVNWFHDSVLAPIRKDFVQEITPYYDYFFIIDSEDVLNHIKIGAGHVNTVPLACAPEVHKSVNLSREEKKKYGSDVCFIGTVKFNRKDVLTQLSDFDLGIWGYWLEKTPKLKRHYRGQHVFGEEAVRIYNASKIILDIHLSYGGGNKPFNVTPRAFEVPASGAFLLADENPLLYDLYEKDKEIVCYKDEKELKELIKYYLNHPKERELIAQRGQKRAYKEHTYKKRLKEIFSIIEKNG
ncbi:MAG: glycosyltransferase [Candidatus Desulfaltia sp.]|nr:glycosyltransferase [Candidatus Desulfaltia sp.]